MMENKTRYNGYLVLFSCGFCEFLEVILCLFSTIVPLSSFALHIFIRTQAIVGYCIRKKIFRQYRTILMVRLRRQIFRQSKQKSARIVHPIRRIFVTNDGKDSADSPCDEFLEPPCSTRYTPSAGKAPSRRTMSCNTRTDASSAS